LYDVVQNAGRVVKNPKVSGPVYTGAVCDKIAYEEKAVAMDVMPSHL